MARARVPTRATAVEPTEVQIRYDLFDLPTAFHKAGLGGLLMLIDSLQERQHPAVGEGVYDLAPTVATVRFTEPLMRALMDDVYDARPKEIAVKSKWQGAEVARPPTPAETDAGTPFVYRIVQPRGQFLMDHYPDGDGLWVKMWRDMLWAIPRGRPTTREPYNQRAAGEPCKEGPTAWANLLKVARAARNNGFHTAELSSALYPGAQASNAEGVPFDGRAEQNLLLHFWPLAVRLYVPQVVEADGTTDLPSASFAVAVPDVSNLKNFIPEYRALLAGLKTDARGYRPAQAVIDLPAEGALAILNQLAAVTGLKVEADEWKYSLNAVEYLHLVKEGNNVKAMAAGRVSPNKKLLVEYRAITEPPPGQPRPPYRNPLFRRGLLTALLNGEDWFRPFGRTFADFRAEAFVRRPRRADDEKGPPQFATDAAHKLQTEARHHYESLKRMAEMLDAPRPPAPLAVIVNKVVRTYLLERTADKSGISLKPFTTDKKVDWSKVPRDFNEAKQKLALGLILEFRSRREQAFVNHFATTILSVTQRVKEADRLALATALTSPDRTDELKTLTLLALSANS